MISDHEEDTLQFVDPDSGETHSTITLPAERREIQWSASESSAADRLMSHQSFSADWQYLAWTVAGELHVARLDAATARYEQVYSISAKDQVSYSNTPPEYWNARFSPDGETLWFEARTTSPSFDLEVELVSIPFADPDAEPAASGVKLTVVRSTPASPGGCSTRTAFRWSPTRARCGR